MEEVRKDFRSELAKAKVLLVGSDPSANLICLGYAGKWSGQVYFFDHEIGMLVPLAESFPEFVAGLSKLRPGDWARWAIVG